MAMGGGTSLQSAPGRPPRNGTNNGHVVANNGAHTEPVWETCLASSINKLMRKAEVAGSDAPKYQSSLGHADTHLA
eukprot:CAMPEP_0198568008 /NCGR_PEP_ID=MMETSP1462-20131121/105714_1 /TAXON_ID=1333877 /ORGANISM="Brandtodinium nutriculum, Strain RCC3387" /LENGTH=75 /DNA_ID=CAMNT_0044299067 /DNA_START=5 /DNA_END=228 /DNA_ORIENTATION=+